MRWRRQRQLPEIRFLALNPSSAKAREFRVLKSEIAIGSAEENQFVIPRASVSRRHATLAYRKDHYELFDSGSTNGTFLNGTRVTDPAKGEAGDEVRLRDALFALARPLGVPAASTRAPGKGLSRRGLSEAIVLAFAVGFGAAQYLAYLFYHEQNRLILAEAVPIPAAPAANVVPPNAAPQPSARTTSPPAELHAHLGASRPATELRAPPKTSPRTIHHARPPETPVAVARERALTIPELKHPAPVGDKELAGGITLAGLIKGSGTAAGRPAPDLSLPDLDGNDVSLAEMRGKIVLLNFWATWCGACRSEMPSLEGLYRDFRSYPDFAVLTVNIDNRSGKQSVARVMAIGGYDFPVLLDGENAAKGSYGVSGISSTFMIGRQGRIIWNCVGALDWSNQSLRDALKKLL
jgi:peroxiredoxin